MKQTCKKGAGPGATNDGPHDTSSQTSSRKERRSIND